MIKLGKRKIYKDYWKKITQKDIKAYMSLLILTGVYRYGN